MTKFYQVKDHYFMVREGKDVLHIGPEVINNLSVKDFVENPANFNPDFTGEAIGSDTFLDALTEVYDKLGLDYLADDIIEGKHG